MTGDFLAARAQRRMRRNYQGTSFRAQRSPDVDGSNGALWRVNMVAEEQRAIWQGTVGIWFIHADDIHPHWENFVVILMHLRPIEGLAAPKKSDPRSAYEVVVATLNPDFPVPDLMLMDQAQGQGMVILLPADFEAQFPEVKGGDAFAYELVDEMAVDIVEGRLLPDIDYRAQWVYALGMKLHLRANLPLPQVN
jgi:hypothetical protein